MKRATDLTDEEKDIFFEYFYEICELTDQDSPTPWGCPWYHGSTIYLKGNSIKRMAFNFYKDNESHINELE